MNKTNKKKRTSKENGQSMVELAVSIIVLLIILAGTVDLGRIAFQYITIRDSTQEAATFASIFPNNNEQIFARALAGVTGSGVDPSRIEVTLSYQGSVTYSCQLGDACSSDVDTSATNEVQVGDVIEITVTDTAYPITMPLLGTFIGSQTINLSSTIQDVVIRVPED